MLRLHRREQYIPRVFHSIRGLLEKTHRKIHLCIQLDRPKSSVLGALNKQLKKLPKMIEAECIDSNGPLVSDREHYMPKLQRHYAYLRSMCGDLDAACLWDDDMWLTKRGVRELRCWLSFLDCDRIEAESVFLWDGYEQYNARFPAHWQALAFRVYDGDDFPTDIMTHCPRRVTFSPHFRRMHYPLFNAGYMTADDRSASWAAAKVTGKIDAHTKCLNRPPTLVPIDDFQNERIKRQPAVHRRP